MEEVDKIINFDLFKEKEAELLIFIENKEELGDIRLKLFPNINDRVKSIIFDDLYLNKINNENYEDYDLNNYEPLSVLSEIDFKIFLDEGEKIKLSFKESQNLGEILMKLFPEDEVKRINLLLLWDLYYNYMFDTEKGYIYTGD